MYIYGLSLYSHALPPRLHLRPVLLPLGGRPSVPKPQRCRCFNPQTLTVQAAPLPGSNGATLPANIM